MSRKGNYWPVASRHLCFNKKKGKNNMAFIKVTDGTNLFYKDWGTGQPIVFVHGWCINSDSWEYLMHPLAEAGFRCIAYDQRGCGRSDQPWYGYDYPALAGDLASLIEQLDLKEAVLAGHSMGCGVITQYLADYGDIRVKKAVLISTTTPSPAKSDKNPYGVSIEQAEGFINFVKKDRTAYTMGLSDDFFNRHHPDFHVSQTMVDWAQSIVMQASARAATEMIRTMYTDQHKELKNIDVPVLLLHGEGDVTPPPQISAVPTHKLLTNSRLKLFRDQPHGMYIIAPELLLPEITQFINE